MPTVDFTLEDLKPVIKSIVDTSIDARFVMFEEKYDADMTAIQQDFLQIYDRFEAIDNRFDAIDHRFDQLENELKTTSRLVRKHSVDIMELRANTT